MNDPTPCLRAGRRRGRRCGTSGPVLGGQGRHSGWPRGDRTATRRAA